MYFKFRHFDGLLFLQKRKRNEVTSVTLESQFVNVDNRVIVYTEAEEKRATTQLYLLHIRMFVHILRVCKLIHTNQSKNYFTPTNVLCFKHNLRYTWRVADGSRERVRCEPIA